MLSVARPGRKQAHGQSVVAGMDMRGLREADVMLVTSGGPGPGPARLSDG